MTADRREQLADDVRRLAGLAEAAVGEAASIGVEVPEDVARCVACWRHWAWWITGDDHDA